MDKVKKRERNVNFSREETEKVVALVRAHLSIIENKKSDAVTWQEKERAWKAIESEFNSSGAEAFRDAKHLKLKYEALKRDTRKKWTEHYKSGNCVKAPPPLTPVEQKIKDMLLLSVEGVESTCDYDPLDNTISEESGRSSDLAEIPVQTFKMEPTLDTDMADYSHNLSSEMPERLPRKRYFEQANYPITSTSNEVDQYMLEIEQKKCCLCKSKEKTSYDKLAKGKLEIVELQKRIIEEELKEKMLKKQMMEDEMEHKNELYELEKEHMLLKIEILKMELAKQKKL